MSEKDMLLTGLAAEPWEETHIQHPVYPKRGVNVLNPHSPRLLYRRECKDDIAFVKFRCEWWVDQHKVIR